MLIRFGFDIALDCAQETPMISLLAVHPERRRDLKSAERFVVAPESETTEYRDLYDNLCRRFTAPAGEVRIRGEGVVEDDGLIDEADFAAGEFPVAELPGEVLVYLLGSRYCESDKLSQFAWDRFGQHPPGWSRVQAVCDYVHGHIAFDYMQARDSRTAFEAHEEGTGVCRDFTHLGVALCRALNIPARYVNGYLGDIGVEPSAGPMDFNAWMEVYLRDSRGQGRWFTFDPRNNQPRMGRIVIARGRDAADVPLIHSFGEHTLNDFQVWTYEIGEDQLQEQVRLDGYAT